MHFDAFCTLSVGGTTAQSWFTIKKMGSHLKKHKANVLNKAFIKKMNVGDCQFFSHLCIIYSTAIFEMGYFSLNNGIIKLHFK